MADEQFDFEAEFSLLDIGATSSLLRAGTVRPTVLAFTPAAGVEAVSLNWESDGDTPRAFEEARRYLRDLDPVAYTVVAHISRDNGSVKYRLPGSRDNNNGNDFLALAMFARDGSTRGVTYPVRHAEGKLSLGMPAVTDAETTDWRPLGDVWANPYCLGDTVTFRAPDRAVDPSTPLWKAIVELTRLRIHDDQANAEEYMQFLDDLRNGIFIVAGRSEDDPRRVLLRPRTNYNPVGTLTVDAARLELRESAPADVEQGSLQ